MNSMFCRRCEKEVEVEIKISSGEVIDQKGNRVRIEIKEYYCKECNYFLKAEKLSEEKV